jgi:hypothetical protein
MVRFKQENSCKTCGTHITYTEVNEMDGLCHQCAMQSMYSETEINEPTVELQTDFLKQIPTLPDPTDLKDQVMYLRSLDNKKIKDLLEVIDLLYKDEETTEECPYYVISSPKVSNCLEMIITSKIHSQIRHCFKCSFIEDPISELIEAFMNEEIITTLQIYSEKDDTVFYDKECKNNCPFEEEGCCLDDFKPTVQFCIKTYNEIGEGIFDLYREALSGVSVFKLDLNFIKAYVKSKLMISKTVDTRPSLTFYLKE